MSLYAADGSWNVTVVDGSTFTGLYAPDGSYNVFEVDGTSYVGLYAPCGAYNVFVSDGSTLGFYHPSGAVNVSVSPYQAGVIRVTAVSGDLGNDPLTPSAPTLNLTSAAGEPEPEFEYELDADTLHASGAIDGSNFDQIEVEAHTNSVFTALEDEDTYTITAGDYGTAPLFSFAIAIGPLTSGAKWYRARHNHHVAGVDHWSAWSSAETDTVVANSGWNINFYWR